MSSTCVTAKDRNKTFLNISIHIGIQYNPAPLRRQSGVGLEKKINLPGTLQEVHVWK